MKEPRLEREQLFMELCHTISRASKCMSRKVGAVIVNPNNVIMAMGYNGPPRKSPHCEDRFFCDQFLIAELVKRHINPNHYNRNHPDYKGEMTCPRRVLDLPSGEGLHWCPASHAERNAIYQNAMIGGASLKGCRMYINALSPCCDCMKAIIQAGINEIICLNLKWYDNCAKFLAETSGMRVRNYTGVDPLER